MNSALWVSKTGLAAQDMAMATIANNLANVNTHGFKADRAVFEDLFYVIEKQPRAQGFVRARVNGRLYELDELPKLDKQKKHSIDVVEIGRAHV